MTREDSLGKASKELMWKEPFYGFFLLMLNKVWDNKRVPTAGVSKNGINYQLAINEDFWTELSEEHRIGLLKHELLHIAYFHLSMHFNFPDKRMANVAMDMEINQYIDKDLLPEGGIDIDNYSELNLDPKAGCRYYYEQLKQAQKEKEKNGSSGCPNFDKLCDAMDQGQGTVTIEVSTGPNGEMEITIPEHGTWEEFADLPEAEQKLIQNQMNRLLQEAADQTEKKRGTIPGHIQDHLIKISQLEPPKFDWRSHIRRFTGTSTKIFTKKIRRKENRRYSDNPGLKIKMKQHMLLAIDTSGSVSDKEVEEFMSEIRHIHKCGVDVTIIQCDTTIRSIEPYNGRDELKIHGRGGTEFDPVLEYYNENLRKYTSLVYFTDGECTADVKPKAPVLWVLSEQSSMNKSLPGKVIKLEL
jgi:predicted metal-dependent peptidase